ncbi:MAG: hypothetical protein ACI8W8_000107 [Rhodothermales bacterium]
MKETLAIIVGVLVGAMGGYLFSNSLAPEDGSVEARLETAEIELETTKRTILKLEASTGKSRRKRSSMRTSADEVRDVVQRVRDGEEISMDDVVATMRPWMRDMAPLFSRMRQVNHDGWADTRVGEWDRKYHLTPDEKEQLRDWFRQRSEQRAGEFEAMLQSDYTGFVELVQAMDYGFEDSAGVDDVIEGFLDDDQLTQFRDERRDERAQSVEADANRDLARLDSLVELSAEQQDALFPVLVRGSNDYRDGEVEFSGMGDDSGALDRPSRNSAVRKVLSPQQRRQLDEKNTQETAQAEEEMRRIGLSLPADWEALQEHRF